MSTAVTSVKWAPAPGYRECDECNRVILPGEPLATWIEVFAGKRSFGAFIQRDRIKREYCEDCGKLLEDSLTTTEAS